MQNTYTDVHTHTHPEYTYFVQCIPTHVHTYNTFSYIIMHFICSSSLLCIYTGLGLLNKCVRAQNTEGHSSEVADIVFPIPSDRHG